MSIAKPDKPRETSKLMITQQDWSNSLPAS